MNEPTPLPGRGIQPLHSVFTHRVLAMAVFGLVVLAGLPVAWFKGAPKYQAETTLQVAPRYMRNLREDQELDFQSNSQYRQFVEHQRQSIGRHDVLRDALARLGERRALWVRPGETERRAVERLREQLQVSAVADTYLIRVSLEGARPEGLAEITNAVATTFIERMKSEEIFGADERTKNLRQREAELLALIAEKAGRRSVIANDLSLTTFHEGTPNPYDLLVSTTRGKLADARQRRLDADAALAAFKLRGDTTLATRSVQEAVLSDPGLNGLKASLSQRRAALLVQKSGLKADHPGAVAAARELGEIDAELQRQGGLLEGGVRGNLLGRLQGTAEQAAAVERGLQAELAGLESQATHFARLFQDASTLTADLAQHRDELNKVRERINFIGVESTSFGFLRLVTPAMAPELPYGPGRKKLALVVLLAAFALAVAVPIGMDLLDRRVRTVNDAQRLMGIAPAGWQVERGCTTTQVFAQEQVRRMAATLIRNREASGQGVFGFTGCKPGAGVTSLVLELGQELQALGFRVLAVEANGMTRDPRFAAPGPGLMEVLRGHCTAPQAVVEADASHTARVGLGGDGRESVLRLDRLAQALQAWSQAHDFVLVDMPPLLASADAELLARTVGQVLLVVEAGAVTTGEVQRARRLLETLDPSAVGLVVNRIAPFVAGGYLRDLMLETISGRRLGSYFTLPQWRLQLAALTLRLRKAHP